MMCGLFASENQKNARVSRDGQVIEICFPLTLVLFCALRCFCAAQPGGAHGLRGKVKPSGSLVSSTQAQQPLRTCAANPARRHLVDTLSWSRHAVERDLPFALHGTHPLVFLDTGSWLQPPLTQPLRRERTSSGHRAAAAATICRGSGTGC